MNNPTELNQASSRPNIVLIMCDDLGYGDTGFNGNETIRTPHLDRLCGEGAHFTRFYAGGPVCSPTRATCLTGRHYSRYGINHANAGCLPRQEITLAGVARQLGYATGHFGKWHLGTLTKTERDGNRGNPENAHLYSPPWKHGFDVCCSTESKVPTWDPAITPHDPHRQWGEPGAPWTTAFWDQDGRRVTDNLAGDDSRVIVDRAEPFIRQAVADGNPFLAVVWFHTPHEPVVAGPDYLAMYDGFCSEEQHYYGCITAMDEQVGRLDRLLGELGVERDTMLWFCSDNGPEGREDLTRNGRSRGVTGGLRGRKRSLFNGGIAVPALVKWPAVVPAGARYDMPCSTLDYFPTLIERLDWRMPDSRPIDGISLMPLLRGEMTQRPRPIPYRFLAPKRAMFGSPTIGLIDNRYKVLTNLSEDGAEDVCFDSIADPCETRDLVAERPEVVAESRKRLRAFMASCRHSHHGGDYDTPYSPVNDFQEITGKWADA